LCAFHSGWRASAHTARDVRGFYHQSSTPMKATVRGKRNMPVFFYQDASSSRI
jgi:catalase